METDKFERLLKALAALAYPRPVNVLPGNVPGWVGLTDKEILADDVLRYYFGLNGGAGPVSKSGRKIVDALEAKLRSRNT
jgi:hypothetical protein